MNTTLVPLIGATAPILVIAILLLVFSRRIVAFSHIAFPSWRVSTYTRYKVLIVAAVFNLAMSSFLLFVGFSNVESL